MTLTVVLRKEEKRGSCFIWHEETRVYCVFSKDSFLQREKMASFKTQKQEIGLASEIF